MLVLLFAVLSATTGTCRSGPVAFDAESSNVISVYVYSPPFHCIDYCGMRLRLRGGNSVEIAMDQCKTPAVFEVDGPYPIPPERDSMGTAHVRLK